MGLYTTRSLLEDRPSVGRLAACLLLMALCVGLGCNPTKTDNQHKVAPGSARPPSTPAPAVALYLNKVRTVGLGFVDDFSVTEDGRWLAVSSSEGVFIYQLFYTNADPLSVHVANGKRLLHQPSQSGLRWSPVSRYLSVTGKASPGQAIVTVLDVTTGRQVRQLRADTAAWSSNSTLWIARGNRLSTMDVLDGTERETMGAPTPFRRIRSIDYSRSGGRLVWEGEPIGLLCIWDAHGADTAEVGPIPLGSPRFSPDGMFILGHEIMHNVPTQPSGRHFERLVGGRLWVVNLSQERALPVLVRESYHRHDYVRGEWLRDDEHLLVRSWDGELCVGKLVFVKP